MKNKRHSVTLSLIALALVMGTTASNAKNCLWKATSKKGTIYLQGSVHVLKSDHYPLNPAIEAAYSNSTALVLEVNMAEMMSPTAQNSIISKATLTPPETLKSLLSPATYSSLQTVCAQIGLSIQTIERFKPWFASTTLSLVKMQKMGFSAEHGLDKYFFEKAEKDKKMVIGLETLDYQINLFDLLGNENPDDFINRTLAEIKFLEDQLTELLHAWDTGDLTSINRLMLKTFEGYPQLHKKFITERNRLWAKKLSKMVNKKETYMVLVGAGHFGGKDGVLKLMEKYGFKLEQL